MAERYLVDTSVLLRLAILTDPDHGIVQHAIHKLIVAGIEIRCTTQSIRESWSVLTRPKDVNGYGLLPDVAGEVIDGLLQICTPLDDSPEQFDIWTALVRENQVSGKNCHDANQVAAMKYHDISRVLTLDARDFLRYGFVSIVSPSDALAE
jgi:predicted nucleic acid-binding protein